MIIGFIFSNTSQHHFFSRPSFCENSEEINSRINPVEIFQQKEPNQLPDHFPPPRPLREKTLTSGIGSKIRI